MTYGFGTLSGTWEYLRIEVDFQVLSFIKFSHKVSYGRFGFY